MNWEQIPSQRGELFAKIDAVYWVVRNAFGSSITTLLGQNYGAG